MAAPSYGHDLNTFNDCTSVTGFVEASGMTTTDGSGVVDSDLAIYGTTCISESQRKSGLGSLVYTQTLFNLPATYAFFVWHKFFAPNSLDTKANGGIRVLVGSAFTDYRGWYVNGSDTYPYGGWKNYVVDPTQTALASQTQGSPTTNYDTVGIGVNQINGISKGNAFTMDIMRYGRGISQFTLGEIANPATFAGFAVINDNPTTGRLGLIQAIEGGYLWKGLMSLGITATAVYMSVANVDITIDNTEFVATSFNRIEVHNSGSFVSWTSVSISSLGTRSKGQFEMIDNATVEFTGCTFTDMDTFIFQSNGVILETTFRRCGQITLGGSSIDDCLITNSPAASSLLTATLDDITNCAFVSDGSNYAVELNSIGTGVMVWNSQLSGYVTGVTGSPVTGSATGNEAIFVNVPTGTLTINVGAGGTIPSIRTAGATVNVVSSFNLTLTNIPSGVQVTIVNSTTRAELQNTTSTGADIIYPHSGGETVDILFNSLLYDPNSSDIYDLTLPTADSSIKIDMDDDPNYFNPI